MPNMDDRKHFIVKHGLDAFEALPNFIWRTGMSADKVPHRFSQVRLGDRWIGFAYTTSDRRERPLSRVTGFFECVREAEFRDIPPAGLPVSEGDTMAWLIEGEQYGEQPLEPVGVPPFDDLLKKSFWKNQGLVPVTVGDFDFIRKYALAHQFDTTKIPLIGREPENEQEVLAIVVSGHETLGIEKIHRVRTAFPDLLVKIDGSPEKVHLELEVYSSGFFSHGHHDHVQNAKFTGDDLPVAVLCWIDNSPKVKDCVHRVYELQSLIRDNQRMIW